MPAHCMHGRPSLLNDSPVTLAHPCFRAISQESILVSRFVAKTRPTFRSLWRESGMAIWAGVRTDQTDETLPPIPVARHREGEGRMGDDLHGPYARSGANRQAVIGNAARQVVDMVHADIGREPAQDTCYTLPTRSPAHASVSG
jgi:hypothetical protein